MARRSVSKSYPAGHVLFTTGEPCKGLFIIESGKVRIYRTSPSGREQILHNEGPGRAVAELPLIDGGPYPASAITAIESRLFFVPRGEFEALYRENPDVAASIIQDLGKRLRQLVHLTETLAFRDVAARLALFLAQQAEEHGTPTDEGIELLLDRTREELSFELGTARESVSRAFRKLVGKKIISTRGRHRILIADLRALRAFSRPGARPRYE
ncbi:MAG TPA: Crp/Fnr family transcriptional regulator [Gemmatimonadaceae bacterium]